MAAPLASAPQRFKDREQTRPIAARDGTSLRIEARSQSSVETCPHLLLGR
jgi:hypothetical protein